MPGFRSKRFLLLWGLLFLSVLHLQAQDVEIYNRQTGDRYHFPSIPRQMTFEEFDLLGTDVRMQDIFAATIVPGYIHFRIYEKKTAWWLVGLRSAGYAGLAYLALNDKSIWLLLFNPAQDRWDPQYGTDISVAYLSAGLIAGTFFYDWIHGRYLLQKKQNRIRYKYAPLLSMQPVRPAQNPSWAWQAGIQLTF